MFIDLLGLFGFGGELIRVNRIRDILFWKKLF